MEEPNVGTVVACAIIDVDAMEQINDRLGQQGADQLLQQIEDCWDKALPKHVVRRRMDDELIAIEPNCRSLRSFAERALLAVNDICSATGVSVTLGVGSGGTEKTALRSAYFELFRAKRKRIPYSIP